METPEELRRRANQLEWEAKEKQRKQAIQERDNFERQNSIGVYTSDDYCGLGTKEYSFYYGYEETACPKHKIDDCEDRYDCCEREWCFVATRGDKELMRIPKSKIHPENGEEPFWYLVAGIGHFLNKKIN